MAQLERATSRGGKKYFSSGIVKYDEVEAKTIRVGGKNNASGVLEVLDATNTLKVSLNKDGVTLSNGAELINDKGVLSSLQFKSELKVLGFRQLSFEGLSIIKDYLEIYCYIPTDFTIDSAFITLNAYKTNNEYLLPETLDTTSTDGKITNIRAYKMTGKTEWTNSSQFGWFVDTAPTGTEITNAFATGGYTNPTTAAVTITSIDIKASLGAGMNGLIIQTAETIPNAATNAGTTTAAQQAQLAEAVVTIIGYAK